MPYMTWEDRMASAARLELRIDPEHKRLIERAAAAQNRSVSSFVVEVLLERSRSVLSGREATAPRPVGGWSFELPDGWDEPLDDLADWR